MTLNPVQETSDYLKRPEAAKILRVSERTLDRYAADGLLRKITLSPRAIRFHRADVEALLERVA